jgi:hypothetical protein
VKLFGDYVGEREREKSTIKKPTDLGLKIKKKDYYIQGRIQEFILGWTPFNPKV